MSEGDRTVIPELRFPRRRAFDCNEVGLRHSAYVISVTNLS